MSGELTGENTYLSCASKEWISSAFPSNRALGMHFNESEPEQIAKISSMVTPPEVFSVVRMPEYSFSASMLREDLTLFFDSIRDPGNLGTILRTADWFGIKNIVCSKDSVDAYNPKVVQSSMGAIMRVKVHYEDPLDLFESAKRFHVPVYGTTMQGEDLFETSIRIPGIIVFGNEANGLPETYTSYFKSAIRIPDYPSGKSGMESLNIASAVAVVCAEIRRRIR